MHSVQAASNKELAVEYRLLGRTGLEVSALGFGCGAVGGLLIKGDRKEILRVIARAVELGITYFDTAGSYGDGRSEASLGLVLEELKSPVLVGTKVQLAGADLDDIEPAIIAIRVLAGGALSGSAARHINAAGSVAPIGGGQTFTEDVTQSERFGVLIQEGYERVWAPGE